MKHLFKIDRIRIIAYALYAYGFPLLITVLSISLSNHGYFSNQQYVEMIKTKREIVHRKYIRVIFSCWFTYDNPVIWAFGIPFVLLILVRFFLFLTSCIRLIFFSGEYLFIDSFTSYHFSTWKIFRSIDTNQVDETNETLSR